MRSERIDEKLLVRYLLGQLSEEEQAHVEDRAFADQDYLGALEATEADLIDAYVRGELSQSERCAFEVRFLTSAGRWNKVEFARSLAKVTAESADFERFAQHRPTLMGLIKGWSPALKFAAPCVALLCISVTSWLIVRDVSLRSRMVVLETQRRELENREQALRRQLREQQSRTQPSDQGQQSARAPSLIASLVLLPGLSRAETHVEQLTVPASAQIAHIQIELEPRDNYRRFRVELRTRRGEEVLVRSNLLRIRTHTGYAVVFDVPVSALPPGEYELELRGLADDQAPVDVGFYYFGVRNQ
jgi:hypothetical protein